MLMEIRRALPVIKTERPAEARAFYESFLDSALPWTRTGC